MSSLTLDFPPELVEQIAARAAEMLRNESASNRQGSGGRWLRGAVAIAEYLDCPVSRVNALSSAGRIPLERDGSALLAHTSKLDEWITSGGGKRP